MLHTLAIENYRSLRNLELSLGPLTVVTGPNGSGKSNLYRALRLLAETSQQGVAKAVALEGGLDSCFWAGARKASASHEPKRMRLGFASDDFSYALSLGIPAPTSGESKERPTLFGQDPEIKREVIWSGPVYRPASVLVDRSGPVVRMREHTDWRTLSQHLPAYYSLFDTGGALDCPEIATLRSDLRDWRFYDHFRTDATAPARQPQVGTRTPVLHSSGQDLAAAVQTIREIGDVHALDLAIEDAFPGSTVQVFVNEGLFTLALEQEGILRPLLANELSDGTLRYLLLMAALLTPRPPALMVLNEPESSLHPDLLPALARLIVTAAKAGQVWVVSHSSRLVAALEEAGECVSIVLEKQLGQTRVAGHSGFLDGPAWRWPH